MALSKRGKKFTSWIFDIQGNTIKVEVKIHKNESFSSDCDNKDIEFSATSETLHDGGIVKLTSFDINELKKKIKETLKNRLTIIWTKYLIIRPTTYSDEWDYFVNDKLQFHKNQLKCKSGFEIERVEFGKNTNGEDVHRTSQTGHVYPGLPDTNNRMYYSDIFILDTPENIEIIHKLHTEFDILNKRIKKSLTLDGIELLKQSETNLFIDDELFSKD